MPDALGVAAALVVLLVGAVVVFLPQILILFLFLGLLEDTGYMARAAFSNAARVQISRGRRLRASKSIT